MSGGALPIDRLITELAKLPGVGKKTAARLAYHLLEQPKAEVQALADSLLEAADKVRYCKVCNDFTAGDLCDICSDPKRDRSVICVVQSPRDIAAVERTRSYNGLYHVLHGVVDPISGCGPDDIKLKELLKRLESGDVKEVILALNSSTNADSTANYISALIKPIGVKCTVISRGVPLGGDLDYFDDFTLSIALKNRMEVY